MFLKNECGKERECMGKRLFRIAVCDDDAPDREEIERMTQEACRLEQIEAEITCFDSAKTILAAFQRGGDFDLLLLDVMMPQHDGIALAKLLQKNERDYSIVFVSGNREKALQGYEVNAARYLAKPLCMEKLREALRFCSKERKRTEEVLLPTDDGVRVVKPDEIYYIEIVGRKSRIWQKNSSWDTKLSLDRLEEIFDGCGFVRCHKSFIVNCGYVRQFRAFSMELMNGNVIPVSKYRIKEVRKLFFEYFKN